LNHRTRSREAVPLHRALALARKQMALCFRFEDTDGDALEFRLTVEGRLQELQAGRVEIAEVRALEYTAADALVRDAAGDFNFKREDQPDKATVLRALAACAGVAWHGDEPEAPERVKLIDSDGDVIEFRATTDGRLQEYVNGKPEGDSVRRLAYSSSQLCIFDGVGIFCIKPTECLEKCMLLRILAARAGVEWSGDEPVPLKQLAVASWLEQFSRHSRVPAHAKPVPSDDGTWEVLSCHSLHSFKSAGWEPFEAPMALSLHFCDTDGDALEFRLTGEGRLQELQAGRVEIAEVRALEYVAADALVRDAGGDFNFKPAEQSDKAMVLRALAACAGVAWHGDEPEVPERVRFTDTDDDMLEFCTTADGRLQEFVNGKPEGDFVRRLSLCGGRIFDEAGDFCIRPGEWLEKCVLLRILAARAGVEWSGDEPVPLQRSAVTSWLQQFTRRSRAPGTAVAEPAQSEDGSWEMLSCRSSHSFKSGGWEMLEACAC